ncbi:FABP family protein [Rhodococcus antarcticus]|uniref:Peroxynitrite isomerase n=1 Tax=Rhodococcus antarcticus TaxID=2987751 RepID=A0ABY6P0C0_9NOCA|nr:FABP family protein [Rhodococcus antarcticus]UZJ25080.1 FABP family protein [Rhodococcus antarcticus]
MSSASDPAGPDLPATASGDAALAAADVRAAATRGLNLPQLPGLPVPDDTANLRQGPDLNPALLSLLPLVGVWRGEGEASYPTIATHRFGQQVVVAHDGRGFLTWESRSWILGPDGEYVRPAARESGFWRVNVREDGDDTLELLLTHNTGIVELYYGAPISQSAWELATDVVIRTETAKEVTAATRLYGIVEDGDLAWVEERAMVGQPLQPHLSAKLTRHVG